jgi:hypothetical protein
MLQSVDRTIVYRSIDGSRLEHARMRLSEAGGVADGTIVGLYEGRPLRVRHEYTCDSRWHVRNVSIEALTEERGLISLAADEDGIWRRVDGGVLATPVYHCFDVAVGLSPLSLALTLRRLALEPRESAIVNVANIALPSLDVALIEHRYTCLERDDDRRRYRLENFDSGERSVIVVDADGVVVTHEAIVARMWPGVPERPAGA